MGSAMGGLAAGKESRQKAPGYHLPVGLRISPLSGVRFEPPLEREQEYLLGLPSRLGREARELLANEFGVSEEAFALSEGHEHFEVRSLGSHSHLVYLGDKERRVVRI